MGRKKRIKRSFADALRRRRISHVQQNVAKQAAAATNHPRDGINRSSVSANAPAPTWKTVRARLVGRCARRFVSSSAARASMADWGSRSVTLHTLRRRRRFAPSEVRHFLVSSSPRNRDENLRIAALIVATEHATLRTDSRFFPHSK
jgi:hypothetical protein